MLLGSYLFLWGFLLTNSCVNLEKLADVIKPLNLPNLGKQLVNLDKEINITNPIESLDISNITDLPTQRIFPDLLNIIKPFKFPDLSSLFPEIKIWLEFFVTLTDKTIDTVFEKFFHHLDEQTFLNLFNVKLLIDSNKECDCNNLEYMNSVLMDYRNNFKSRSLDEGNGTDSDLKEEQNL